MSETKNGQEEPTLNSKKTYFKRSMGIILKGILGLIVFALIAWMALSLVRAIPTHLVENNLIASAQILADEGTYPSSRTTMGQFDNHTESVMLSEAAYSGENVFIDALVAPFYSEGGFESSIAHSLNGEGPQEYARYWHGYLLVLKPLLVFFDVKTIRLIFQLVFVCLIAVAAILFSRFFKYRVAIYLSLSLVASMVLVGGIDASMTLPVFFSFSLALLGVIWVMRTMIMQKDTSPSPDEQFSINGKLILGFMALGSLTVFFDFLDNPILTLVFPLATYIVAVGKSRDVEIKSVLLLLVACCVAWIFGYGFFWMLKWALATLFTGVNVFASAFEIAEYRTGTSTEGAAVGGAFTAILGNYELLGRTRWLLAVLYVLALCLMLAQIVKCVRVRDDEGTNKTSVTVLLQLFLLLLVSLAPYVWYAVLSNHSIVHSSLIAYRSQAITFFALFICFGIGIGSMLRSGKTLLRKGSKDSAQTERE